MIMDPVVHASGSVEGAANILLHATAPTDANLDVVVLVVDITGELGWKFHDAVVAWMEIMTDARSEWMPQRKKGLESRQCTSP